MTDYKAYIEQMVKEFDKIIFFADENILILLNKQQDMNKKNIVYKRIPEELAEQLNVLYKSYEFADNFILVETSSLYAGMFHYVQTGILTPEEMWQALLE